MARTTKIAFRATPEVKEAAEMAAAKEGRTLSNWVERLVVQTLTRRGFLTPRASDASPDERETN